MNLLLKQRLVGAAVIISLGVVIIPMLLDGSGSRIIQEIPDRPERQSVSGKGVIENQIIPTPLKRDEIPVESIGTGYDTESVAKEKSPVTTKSTVSKIESSASTEISANTRLSAKADIQKKKTSGSKLASWVVQVGSFNEKGKALKLRDQFREKGFSVFMEPFKNADNKNMYRVRVGPVQDRSQAESLLNLLKKKTELTKGYVTQHP